jgi:hypothetical protein
MSIQKKSLISTLKTAKKANVASGGTHEADTKGAKVASMRLNMKSAIVSARAVQAKSLKSLKSNSAKSLKSLKSASSKAIN